jgi:pyrroline-5-carboxylate reductase
MGSRLMKLGFIGSGKMATALVKGVVKSGVCSPSDIIVSDAIPAAAEKLAATAGVRLAGSNAEVLHFADAIVLAVKPQDALAALSELPSNGQAEAGPSMKWAWKGDDSEGRGKLLLSIVAGLTLPKLEEAGGSRFRVIRAMPNTPALVLQGASGFSLGSGASEKDAEIARKVFGSVGVAVQVKESLLDAVTGLSGSGPAYVYMIIEALADGGVLMGLPRELALQLAAQTVAGSATMVMQTGTHPAALRDQVASPGGTTIAGIEALEINGLRAALISAVRAATERARELGK